MRSRSRGPALPIAPASDSTQLNHAPGISDKPRLLPLSVVPRPSTGLPAPPPAARRPTPPYSAGCSGTLSRAPGRLSKRASGPGYLNLQAREACSQASSPPFRDGLNTYWVSQCPSHVLPLGAWLISHLPRISLTLLSPWDSSRLRTCHHISPPRPRLSPAQSLKHLHCRRVPGA